MKKADRALVLERGKAATRAWLEHCERQGEVYHVTDYGRRNTTTVWCRFYTIDLPPFDELIVMCNMAKRPALVMWWPKIEDMTGITCTYSDAIDLLVKETRLVTKRRAIAADGVFEAFYHLALWAEMTEDPHAWAGKVRLVEL